MLMPNSEGDLPFTGADAADKIRCSTSRTVLSPVKIPPETFAAPLASVEFVTAVFVEM